jgi:phosphoribosylanthranilate isomerase
MSLLDFDPQKTKIKICGLKAEIDVHTAVELNIDAIGLVFFEPSPRNITLEQAKTLSHLHEGKLENVALVVDASDTLIRDIKKYCQVDLWQFHGNETPERCAAIAGTKKWIKAARIDEKFQIDQFCLQYRDANAWLLDAVVDGYGGGGKTFNWELIPELWSKENAYRVVLSGGLNSSNVAEAITQFRPLAVDISSGVEISKGKKDPELMNNFVMRVRKQDQILN